MGGGCSDIRMCSVFVLFPQLILFFLTRDTRDTRDGSMNLMTELNLRNCLSVCPSIGCLLVCAIPFPRLQASGDTPPIAY